MIHTRDSSDVTLAGNNDQWNVKIQEGRGEDGLFHQLIDFPWLPGDSREPGQLWCPVFQLLIPVFTLSCGPNF